MAHTIKLKYGSPASWSYIDLTDSDHGNVDYYPGTPAEGADEITESGQWRVAGSSVANLIAAVTAIEQVFYKAGVYNLDEIGAYQVWVTIVPDGTSDTWESQVFEGGLELTEDIFGVDWANKSTDVVLIWRRAGWWKKYTAVAATNSNESSGTYTVFNGGDSSGSAPNKHENWLSIAAAAVPGDLPAPAMITFTPASAMTQFTVINNARAPISVILREAEDAEGSNEADATRSSGHYGNYVTPVGGSTGVDTPDNVSGIGGIVNGAWIRVLLSAFFTGTVYARPYFEIGAKRYYGPKSVLIGATAFVLYDLGLVRIPANVLSGLSINGILHLGINFIAASAITLAIDYFHYIPTDYYAKGVLDVDSSTTVMLNTHENAFLGITNFEGVNTLTGMGTLYGGIYLEPNMDQKLYFKMTAGAADTMANHAVVAISAWLRKRTL